MNYATDALSKLSQSYEETTKVVNTTGQTYNTISETLSAMQAGGKSYKEQLEVLNKNLSELNAVYEIKKKGVDNHIKESDSIYQGLRSDERP
jgi:hypothetical protein